ncbi:hypothetical protein QAD02_013788 [Eretmocerus hayati]|uniref:Uncharacterized protein n=1 Tax=Eretmocerus hayati TaxID=131215 RepID=A0ACC2P4J6_9HYME|nr:hypothetical protein QAD02_013788 [Eretmocerus hayati]
MKLRQKKRRYKKYISNPHELRSRATKYRNVPIPSSISASGIQDEQDHSNTTDTGSWDNGNMVHSCSHGLVNQEPYSSSKEESSVPVPSHTPSPDYDEYNKPPILASFSGSPLSKDCTKTTHVDSSVSRHWDRDAHKLFLPDGERDSEADANHVEQGTVTVDDEDRLGGFPRLRSFINNNENNEVKQASVNVTNCEILLAVLKYALTYSLSHTAVADLSKLICVLMDCDDLPSSHYLIDKLFNNTGGVLYHACCPECKKYVSKFDQSTKKLKCPNCRCEIDVKSPTYNEFFAIIDPRLEIANLLESHLGIPENPDEGQINSLPLDVRLRSITLPCNADGAALYKSFNYSIWPIQAIINELPYRVRTASPVTCGICFRKDKPDMQIFLRKFVLSMNNLSVEGIPCKAADEIVNVKVYCPRGCVDSMASGSMQGMKLCTGYFGCNWCLHPGLYVGPGPGRKGAFKYVVSDDIPERTGTETKKHMREAAGSTQDISGVKNASWLIHLFYFNIILGFVPDPMHYVDLGLGKQFLERWLTMLTPNEKSKIDSYMKKIKVPNNVQRLPRPIKDGRFWKAQEWENFILYYSLPLLRAFPCMSQIADHWSLLVERYYKLMKATVTLNNIQSAHELFKQFVVMTEAIYSK